MRKDKVTQPSRFFDVETGGPIQLQVQQVGADFRVLRQFGYHDPQHDEPFVVPADVKTFSTDLASIPVLFSWLVPGLGTHLPAVLLHDGLVDDGRVPSTYAGPRIQREEADRILRDGMASLGTPTIRRWLMWTAVIVATAWSTLRPRWWWRVLVVATLTVIAVLGVVATLDLADAWDVLPWMGDRPWFVEVAGGAAVAILVPFVLSVPWRRLWRAGAIAGLALAFLLHITAVLFVLYGVYWLAEAAVSRREGASPSAKRNLQDAVGGST